LSDQAKILELVDQAPAEDQDQLRNEGHRLARAILEKHAAFLEVLSAALADRSTIDRETFTALALVHSDGERT
jgi:hypothetical protein